MHLGHGLVHLGRGSRWQVPPRCVYRLALSISNVNAQAAAERNGSRQQTGLAGGSLQAPSVSLIEFISRGRYLNRQLLVTTPLPESLHSLGIDALSDGN